MRKIEEKMPVARFFYKGSHTHPVKRTVLLIEITKNFLRGYEIRNGKNVNKLANAPIKSYRKDKIAKGANLRVENPLRSKKPNKTTLVRLPLLDLVENGA